MRRIKSVEAPICSWQPLASAAQGGGIPLNVEPIPGWWMYSGTSTSSLGSIFSPTMGCASDPVPELPSRIAEVPDPGQVVRSMLEMDALEVIEDRSPSLESGHRPLSPDLVGPPDRFQDGNSDFGYCFHQGGGFHDLRGSQGWVSPDTDPTRFTSIPPLRLGVTQGFAPGSTDLRWSRVMIPRLGHDLSIVIDFGKSTLVSKIRAKFVVLISASVALRVSLQTPRFSDSWRYRNAS